MLKSFGRMILMLVLAAAPIAAHQGHAHRYMGTITAVNGAEIELKTTAGKTLVFKLDDKTRITKGPDRGSREDLTAGTRAVVEAEGGAQPTTAKTIKLPAASQAKSSS